MHNLKGDRLSLWPAKVIGLGSVLSGFSRETEQMYEEIYNKELVCGVLVAEKF